MWMSPVDVVNMFNVILGELRRAAMNPESLPKPLAITDPKQVAADKLFEMMAKQNSEEEVDN